MEKRGNKSKISFFLGGTCFFFLGGKEKKE
jgi:hypothetical protein